MLLGLAALPALAAVYWFRSRSRRAVVSSLAFWIDPHTPRQGGRILARMQTPLTLLLELLAITALVLAAAGPALVRHDLVRPLVVVLDDSYSMLAASGDGSDSSRKRAATALNEALRGGDYLARFVLAGARPRLAGDPVREAGRVAEVLEQWTCQEPTADLPAAVALAAEVGGPTARILVLSDHAPPTPLEGGQVEWWACGEPLANLAFTAATRTVSGEKERVLLEVANLSDSASQGTLTLEGGNLASARTSRLDLAAGAVRQVILDLPAAAPPLRATLDRDALDIDNHVVLLPAAARPLRVLVDLAETKLRQAVVRALAATDQTLEVGERPDLVVSDHGGDGPGDAWRLEILPAANPAAYAGPFVINHNQPLAQGLSLANAVWSAVARRALGRVADHYRGQRAIADRERGQRRAAPAANELRRRRVKLARHARLAHLLFQSRRVAAQRAARHAHAERPPGRNGGHRAGPRRQGGRGNLAGQIVAETGRPWTPRRGPGRSPRAVRDRHARRPAAVLGQRPLSG